MSFLKENLEKIESNISAAAKASGRQRKDITLLAVTKTWPAKNVKDAHALGLRQFGENYVQEYLQKKKEITDLNLQNLEWHFIGHLQSNKVKNIVGEFSYIHSVDRMSLAKEISLRAAMSSASASPQKILIEVNVANEESKSGLSISQLPSFLDEIQNLPALIVCGLMVMPPILTSAADVRHYFDLIRDERDRWTSRLSAPHSLVELSMGTSHDYVLAIESGATMVRLGTVLFGEREKK